MFMNICSQAFSIMYFINLCKFERVMFFLHKSKLDARTRL